MSRVRGRDTKPERIVRSMLHRMGFRFRLHRRGLPGTPDIVLPGHRKIVFVHGCFWHGHDGCARSKRPETRREFWDNKIDATIKRDEKCGKELRELGWNVLTVWECECKKPDMLREKLEKYLCDE